MVKDPAKADIAIVCVGLGHGRKPDEGDREESDRTQFELSADQVHLIQVTFQKNPRTIVVCING